jgi:hypothetical protein
VLLCYLLEASKGAVGASQLPTYKAIVTFFRLTFLRPVERFLAQVISISTEPSAFVRERIHLGDTTNFLRAAGFFVSAISSAFLAEVATLYLLGIGNLTEPYYWFFILLTSIPFVLICFLFVRFVAPLSFRDVLHLSFYPIGAGVFVGAAFALMVSGVVRLLVDVGYIPGIRFDFSQWGEEQQLIAVGKRVLYDCLKNESLLFTVVASGLEEAYTNLRPPIDDLSYLRPVITVLYLLIAARFFMAAVNRRKPIVLGVVLLAALVATGVNFLSLKTYLDWNVGNSSCTEQTASGKLSLSRMAESALKEMAQGINAEAEANDIFDVSVGAEGRTLSYTYRFKRPWPNPGAFYRWESEYQKTVLDSHCSDDEDFVLRLVKATETHTFYSSVGERLTSFSISPGDCPK